MKVLKIVMMFFVALLVFVLSFVVSGRYLDDVFYYKNLQALLEHEDEVEDVLKEDLKRVLSEVEQYQNVDSSEKANICNIIKYD